MYMYLKTVICKIIVRFTLETITCLFSSTMYNVHENSKRNKIHGILFKTHEMFLYEIFRSWL